MFKAKKGELLFYVQKTKAYSKNYLYRTLCNDGCWCIYSTFIFGTLIKDKHKSRILQIYCKIRLLIF